MSLLHHPHPFKGMRPWTRHSVVLVVAGIVYFLIGFSYFTTKATPSRHSALHYALEWMPLKGWGVVFAVVGLMAIISSRWPPVAPLWGYTALTALSAGWAAFYLVGVLFDGSPIQNLTGTLSWGVIAFLWWAISGLINPSVIKSREG